MTVNVLGVSTPTKGSSSGSTVNVGGPEAGEFLVMLLAKNNANDIITIPDGWTFQRKHWYSYHTCLHILTRLADGNESATVDLDTGSTTRWNAVCIHTDAIGYRGDGPDWGSATPWNCPSFDTDADHSAALRIVSGKMGDAFTVDNVTKPAGELVMEGFQPSGASEGNYLGVVKTDHPDAGATGAVAFVPPASNPFAGITIQLTGSASSPYSIDDVDGDGEVTDGQAGATISLSGFTGTPTLTLKYGAFETSALSYTGDDTGGTFNVPDYAATVNDVTGVPVGQTVKLVATNGAEVAEFDIVIQPKTGWAVTVGLGIEAGLGRLTADAVAEDSVALYNTANNTNILPTFVYQTDVMPLEVILWNSDTGVVEKVTMALPAAPDAEDPTVPINVTPVSIGVTTASFACDPASDNVGVTGYRFFLDGVPKGTSATPGFTFTGLTAGQSYIATATAYDAAANESEQSAGVSFTTDEVPVVYAAFFSAVSMGPGNAQKFKKNHSLNRYENADQSVILPLP